MSDFESAATHIKDRDGLARFVQDLATDRRNNPNSWENTELDTFLEAMSAWLKSADNLYRNFNRELPEQASWAFFAEMLLAARVYE
jgi:hypothetical protein